MNGSFSIPHGVVLLMDFLQLNRRVMMTLFFIPLVVVAFFESNLDTRKNMFMKVWFSAADEGEEDDPNNQDPEVHEEDADLKICKVKFADLVARFPDTTVVSSIVPCQVFGDFLTLPCAER